ncbi:MAG: hypothetical protein ACKVOU_03955 [Cytophagales bacterium]
MAAHNIIFMNFAGYLFGEFIFLPILVTVDNYALLHRKIHKYVGVKAKVKAH